MPLPAMLVMPGWCPLSGAKQERRAKQHVQEHLSVQTMHDHFAGGQHAGSLGDLVCAPVLRRCGNRAAARTRGDLDAASAGLSGDTEAAGSARAQRPRPRSQTEPSTPGSSSSTDLRQLCRLRLSRPATAQAFPPTSGRLSQIPSFTAYETFWGPLGIHHVRSSGRALRHESFVFGLHRAASGGASATRSRRVGDCLPHWSRR